MRSDTKKIKVYNIEKTFELNPDMKIKVHYVGKNKLPVLEIKNFYKNPELVRQLVIDTPVPDVTSKRYGGYPGRRINLAHFISSKNFWHKYSDILRKYFNLDFHLIGAEEAFIANIFDSSGLARKRNNLTPHADYQEIASVIYLNYDDEEVSGTAIYRHKESDLEFFPYSEFHFNWYAKKVASAQKKRLTEVKSELHQRLKKYEKKIFVDFNDPNRLKKNQHIFEDNDEWEILANMKSEFNKLVAYIGGILHSPMIDYDELKNKDYYRINQVIFMERA